MRRTRPHRLQDIERQLQRAYRDWQAPPLRPTTRPPGLSRLPTPTRPTMAAPPVIPIRVEAFTDVPVRLRPVYERDDRSGYRLDAAGALLNKYRAAVATDPTQPAIWRAGRKPELSRKQWATLLAVASPGEEREA